MENKNIEMINEGAVNGGVKTGKGKIALAVGAVVALVGGAVIAYKKVTGKKTETEVENEVTETNE